MGTNSFPHRGLPEAFLGENPIAGYVFPISTSPISHSSVPDSPNPQT